MKNLFEVVILPRVTSSSRIYNSYARFLFAQGDLSASLVARMKAYRVDVVLNEEVATNKIEFERAAERVMETVDILRNLGGKEVNGHLVTKDWRVQARSVLRSFLGRTKDTFGDETIWAELHRESCELRSS